MRKQVLPNNLQQLDALQLVRFCLRSRDEAAWYEFVRRFQPLIASVVVKTLRRWTDPDPGLVDDLVQETYLRLCIEDFRPLRGFDFRHENSFLGFLKVIASNVVQDYFRNRYSQKRGSGKIDKDLTPLAATVPARENFVEKAHREILLHQFKKCLQRQSSDPHSGRNFAIFSLYFEQGFTAEAIARNPHIGLSTKGVESALLRVKRVLKASLGKPFCSKSTAGLSAES